jgi:hypothetical protein
MVAKTVTVMDACRRLVEVEVPASGPSARIGSMNERDADRLELLDRIAHRLPDLDLDRHSIEWSEMPDDGSEALMVDGGGIDGGDGFTLASHGDDLHAIGPTSPLIPGCIGCVVIAADGSRRLARVMPDPLT